MPTIHVLFLKPKEAIQVAGVNWARSGRRTDLILTDGSVLAERAAVEFQRGTGANNTEFCTKLHGKCGNVFKGREGYGPTQRFFEVLSVLPGNNNTELYVVVVAECAGLIVQECLRAKEGATSVVLSFRHNDGLRGPAWTTVPKWERIDLDNNPSVCPCKGVDDK